MARKARQRISYVLPLADQTVGHRLGVNGIAIDETHSYLYSGGRDGMICEWKLDNILNSPHDASETIQEDHLPRDGNPNLGGRTTYCRQVQAHTHWINDLVVANNGEALISASSDVSVKLWRPRSDGTKPQTIGLHSDYVKCLSSPGLNLGWVASGGLDHKVCVWDLSGAGQSLQISTADKDSTNKGSIYAIAAKSSMIASGGPENLVKVWDPRSGRRIVSFVGHTDNIRSILLAKEGELLISASSDQTVKIWSMTAGRCMYTLTMHNDSVWSLYSSHSSLSVFYSGDRSGLVAKTDTREAAEIDEGLCVALCQESDGVNRIVAAGENVWTATSRSNINRWQDIDTKLEIQIPEALKSFKWGARSQSRSSNTLLSESLPRDGASKQDQISIQSVLRLSNLSSFPPFITLECDRSGANGFQATKLPAQHKGDVEENARKAVRDSPVECLEGQNGLTKHIMLNDRRRVLALDTAGNVVMWDIVKCVPIHSYGKRNIDDVTREVNTTESVAHWCAVDTRTGSLTCILEENYCFDAEMYADELDTPQPLEFRDDQRINMGKWVLRYLFAGLIDEELRRDEGFRTGLTNGNISRKGVQGSYLSGWSHPNSSGPETDDTISELALRAGYGPGHSLRTPGLSIGVVTPGAQNSRPPTGAAAPLSPTVEESSVSQRSTSHSQVKSSWERASDYFSSKSITASNTPSNTMVTKGLATPIEGVEDAYKALPVSASDTDKESQIKDLPSSFSKRLRIPFTARKSSRAQHADNNRDAAMEGKADDPDSKSSRTDEAILAGSLGGVIQRIQLKYVEMAKSSLDISTSLLTPSTPSETPPLDPPSATRIVIQEDRPDAGGVVDLYEGTVGTIHAHADLVEKVAPAWLGDLLLQNMIAPKDAVKVLFVLEPYDNILPVLPTMAGENDRLNANRMLRARKILAYVADRLEVEPNEPDAGSMRPEDYLELYCQNQLIPPLMTLATIRTNIWRNANDVVLQYKPNGRRKFVAAQSKALLTIPLVTAQSGPKNQS